MKTKNDNLYYPILKLIYLSIYFLKVTFTKICKYVYLLQRKFMYEQRTQHR
jgi:hypothetical protein